MMESEQNIMRSFMIGQKETYEYFDDNETDPNIPGLLALMCLSIIILGFIYFALSEIPVVYNSRLINKMCEVADYCKHCPQSQPTKHTPKG